MTKKQVKKLKDYVDGFIGLGETRVSPIGAILVEESEHKHVLNFLKDKKMVIFNNSDDNQLENDLKKIANAIEKGLILAINSSLELSPKLYNLFLNFSHGKLAMYISGQEMKIINPVPATSKILFVLSEELFDNGERFGKIITSVCRL